MTGTVTRGKALRNDTNQYDGLSLTGTRTNSSGGTFTGVRFGDYVDVLMVYGSGTDYTGASIQSAIDAIGSANCTLKLAPGAWVISSSLTIASNFTVWVPAGCVLTPDSGVTLTISGVLFREHGTYTGGDGTVTASGTDILAAQDNTSEYAADTGSADIYTIDVGANPASYSAGQMYRFKAANTNTGASTLNVDGLGAKTIVQVDGSTALSAGDITAGQVVTVHYDGTNFQLQPTRHLGSALSTALDLNGQELILDADGDTSITADTDDRVDIKIGGSDSILLGTVAANTGYLNLNMPALSTPAGAAIYSRVFIQSTNAMTVPLGTSTLVASLVLTDPNLVATGTITNSAALYVGGAATEAANNYAILVDGGDVSIDDNLLIGTRTAVSPLTLSGDADMTGTVTITGDAAISGSGVVLTATSSDTSEIATIISTDAGAAVGPALNLYRNSASPATSDDIGAVYFAGKNSTPAKVTYAQIHTRILDKTAASEDADIRFSTRVAGSNSLRMVIANGMYMAGATGTDQGAGTINATTVYDDGVDVTCYPLEAAITGGVDIERWNAMSLHEEHQGAKAFISRMGRDLDPDAFAAQWKATGHLPSLPSPDEWGARGKKIGAGEMIQRLWETVDLFAVHIDKVNAQNKALAERVAALEA